MFKYKKTPDIVFSISGVNVYFLMFSRLVTYFPIQYLLPFSLKFEMKKYTLFNLADNTFSEKGKQRTDFFQMFFSCQGHLEYVFASIDFSNLICSLFETITIVRIGYP